LIAAGERRPRRLFSEVETRRVAPTELADMRYSELFFINVNTPDDFAQAKERMKDEGGRMKEVE
jgi:molybdopterin-guanine dinucleotide biosynthesis protein A